MNQTNDLFESLLFSYCWVWLVLIFVTWTFYILFLLSCRTDYNSCMSSNSKLLIGCKCCIKRAFLFWNWFFHQLLFCSKVESCSCIIRPLGLRRVTCGSRWRQALVVFWEICLHCVCDVGYKASPPPSFARLLIALCTRPDFSYRGSNCFGMKENRIRTDDEPNRAAVILQGRPRRQLWWGWYVIRNLSS